MKYLDTDVSSIDEFVDNNQIADELRRCAVIRDRTLTLCSGIPGYGKLSLETKNSIYDHIKEAVKLAMEGETDND